MRKIKEIAPALLVLVSISVGGTACDDSEDRPHPLDLLRFPTDLVLGGEDSGLLYVVGSNFDRTYDGGVLQALDVVALDAVVDAAGPSLPLRLGELPWRGGAHIGSFGGQVARAPLFSGGERLFVPMRGEGGVAIIDVSSEGDFSCHFGEGIDCRGRSLLLPTPPGLEMADPFASAVVGDHVFVAALRTQRVDEVEGTLSAYMARIPVEDPSDVLIRSVGGMLTRDLVTGPDGINLYSVGSRTATTGQGLITNGELRSFPAAFFEDEKIQTEALSLTQVVGSNDGRSLAFSADGSQALVLTRSPSALVVFEARGGVGSFSARATIPLPESPSRLTMIEQEGITLAAITATAADALIIVDLDREQVVAVLDGTACHEPTEPCPEGSRSLSRRDPSTDMGIQPWALVAVPRSAGGVRIWVGSFADGTLRAVDIPDLRRPWVARVAAIVGEEAAQ